MTTSNTWPFLQSWHADGVYVGVLLKELGQWEDCRTCGQRGAVHFVMTRRDEFCGEAYFCEAHRPAEGTLPEIDYERVTHDYLSPDIWIEKTERLKPTPSWPCNACGAPSAIRREYRCHRCTNPDYCTVTDVRSDSSTTDDHIERAEKHITHDTHTFAVKYHCPAHRPGEEDLAA